MQGHDDQLPCNLKEEARHLSRDVLLAVDPASSNHSVASDVNNTYYNNLSDAIYQRIASRAQGRIHDLNIHIEGKTVVLSGHCATYYSKQLAQHAAQGIMDNEHLENKIQVFVPR